LKGKLSREEFVYAMNMIDQIIKNEFQEIGPPNTKDNPAVKPDIQPPEFGNFGIANPLKAYLLQMDLVAFSKLECALHLAVLLSTPSPQRSHLNLTLHLFR